jgi:acetylglutamate kinase
MHMVNEYASPSAICHMLVLKYGGNAMPAQGHPEPVLAEVAQLWKGGMRVVVVHGGGPEIDAELAGRGIPTRRLEGLRVTDAATLHVTEAVLCGTLNKRLVRACVALGVAAAGISGQDGPVLVAQRERGPEGADLGYVGRIETVDVRLIETLLNAGFLPVVAPLAVEPAGAQAYNVNADLAAGAIAAALTADAFVALTNVPRVLRDAADPRSAIDRFTPDDALRFAQSPACGEKMKPKLLAASSAVAHGAKAAYIAGAKAHAIAAALEGDATVIA